MDDDYDVTDVGGIVTRRRRTDRPDSGHYTDIHSVVGGRPSYYRQADDPYHYIDIDRQTDGYQSVTPRGYEGLDQAVLATQHHQQQQQQQPAPTRDGYVGLVSAPPAADVDDNGGDGDDGDGLTTTAQHGDDIELTVIHTATDNRTETAVSLLLTLSNNQL